MDQDERRTVNRQQRPAPRSLPKLAPIPKGTKIQKRPLPHRPQPASPATRVLYVSSKASLMSVVRRAQKHLDRASQQKGPETKGMKLDARIRALERGAGSAAAGSVPLEVVLLGTGRAIEKTLALAAWFEERAGYAVQIRTKTVGAVDDVVPRAWDGDRSDEDAGVDVEEEAEAEEQSRVRRVSCLEVTVKSRT